MANKETADSQGQHSYNSGYGYDYQEETSEIWVADFGSHDIEQSLREEIAKIKPRLPKYVSWIFSAAYLLIILVLAEWLIRILGRQMFWPEIAIFWVSWIWRLVALVLWTYVARVRWLLDWRKFFTITALAFILAVFVSGILKLFYVQAAWAWLNLLVDPIWMALLIILGGNLFYKLANKNLKN